MSMGNAGSCYYGGLTNLDMAMPIGTYIERAWTVCHSILLFTLLSQFVLDPIPTLQLVVGACFWETRKLNPSGSRTAVPQSGTSTCYILLVLMTKLRRLFEVISRIGNHRPRFAHTGVTLPHF